MGKKKKFIDKKNAVSFHLVHRSQKDPLQAADDVPEHVLMQAAAPSDDPSETRRGEQRKFGVFYDDDYDYMQHLRDVSELNEVGPGRAVGGHVDQQQHQLTEVGNDEPSLQLPSEVFGSTVETDVGMLNKAVPLSGPQLDWDPDIVEALDDDFDFDNPANQLDDDFVAVANATPEDGEEPETLPSLLTADRMKEYFRPQIEDDDGDFPSDEADDFSDDYDSDSQGGMMAFAGEETKSHFTNYSMTSSVIRRNEGLTLLDDRFETLYEQYNDNDIGALDHEDIEGGVQQGSKVLDAALEQFEKDQIEQKLKDVVLKAQDIVVDSDSESSEAEDLVKVSVEEPREKWDCESILSTYSTLYNHPQTIKEPKKVHPIKLGRKGKVVLPEKEAAEKAEATSRLAPSSTYRPRNETAEEKLQRKRAVKLEKAARREEKKSNKLAFKAEEIRQHKEQLNLKTNMEGIKMM